MKNLLLFGVLLVLTACSSPEKKAKELIKNNLYQTLNDFDSYEPISYGDLDSLFSTYDMDSVYIKNEKMLITLKNLADAAQAQFNQKKDQSSYSSKGGQWEVDVSLIVANIIFEKSMYDNIRDSVRKNYIPKFIGYKMNHKYRSKNTVGGVEISDRDFCLDANLTEIFIPTTLVNDTTPVSDEDVLLLIAKAKADPAFGAIFPR